jgi:hypothetical protein
MKKILFFALCAITLASCSEENPTVELYCEKPTKEFYTDKNAELDTLSYATGMNYGLGLNLGSTAEFDIDIEAIINTMATELKKNEADEKTTKEHQEWMRNFSMKRANPYMLTKQFNSQIKTDRPDTLALPALFDEEFTRDMFQTIMATNMANAVREQNMPINLHWTFEAMRDSEKVGTPQEIDSVMRITEKEFNTTLQNYFTVKMPANNLERSMAWYKKVASKPNVKSFEITDRPVPLTVYYRVNKAGNGTKPENRTDSIAVKYSVYSRTGKLLESNQSQIDALDAKIKAVKESKMLQDSVRNITIANFEKEKEQWVIRKVTFDRFMQADVREVLKHFGAGSNITMWMPATSALHPMAARNLAPNEAVVVNVELVGVKTIEPKVMPAMMNTKVRPVPGSGIKQEPAKVSLKAVTKK